MLKIERNFGELGTLKNPKEALNNIKEYNWTEYFDIMFANSLVGSKHKVKKVIELKNEINFDKLTLLTWCYDESERINSYKIFSEMFN